MLCWENVSEYDTHQHESNQKPQLLYVPCPDVFCRGRLHSNCYVWFTDFNEFISCCTGIFLLYTMVAELSLLEGVAHVDQSSLVISIFKKVFRNL